MEIVNQITEDQWLTLADLVTEGLREKESTGEPLELSYELVKQALGYSGEVDFYMALWNYHQQRHPVPAFWFHGRHRPSRLPDALLFYPRARG